MTCSKINKFICPRINYHYHYHYYYGCLRRSSSCSGDSSSNSSSSSSSSSISSSVSLLIDIQPVIAKSHVSFLFWLSKTEKGIFIHVFILCWLLVDFPLESQYRYSLEKLGTNPPWLQKKDSNRLRREGFLGKKIGYFHSHVHH